MNSTAPVDDRSAPARIVPLPHGPMRPPFLLTLRPFLWSVAALVAIAAALEAGPPSVVRLETPGGTFHGKSLQHNPHVCWLAEKDGRLHNIRLRDVTHFHNERTPFRPESVTEARDRLRRQTPPGMEVAALGRYVVVGPTGQTAAYARLLEAVYADYWSFFSRRQFALQQPEFPLIVYVFPTQELFAEYARAEGTPVAPGLKGYYHRRSNRIALFAPSPPSSPASATPGQKHPDAPILGAVDGDLRTTLIHEATHQLAYNTGLHSRMGDGPRWISEGLAMLFEEDSRRDDSGSRDPSGRVHRSRYVWFMNYRRNRRPQQSLERFLSSDDTFTTAGLDAYSEAWALSFYLIETRRADYARYLQKVAARDPLVPYIAEDRLADFQSCFGKDLAYFEGQYLLFIDRLKVQ